MKNVILILLLAVSAAAQSYDVVTITPNTADIMVTSVDEVYGTTWGHCIAVCTNQCLEGKEGSREECGKICTDKCHPQPDVITKRLPPIRPEPRTCLDVCSQKFKVCEDSQRNVDCKSIYEQCANACQPQLSCEGNCKRIASQSGDALTAGQFNAGLYVECVTSRCGANCERACMAAFGAESKNCIMKLCKPDMPQSCEGRCEMIRDDCKEANVDPKSCQMKIDDCKRQCKPECPEIEGCPVKCTGMYYECRASGKDGCEKALVGCLESCRPGRIPLPAYRCEDKCIKMENECIEAGNAKEACMPRTEECMKQCRPQPPSGKCEDVCMKIGDECSAAGVDDESCRMKINDCLKRCEQPPEAPSCRERCVTGSDECIKAGKPREECINMRSACLKECGESEGNLPEGKGVDVKGEQGFFARLWAGMFG